jgi:hypothetical protein
MPSTVQSTHRGGVYTIYSTLNTQARSLCHLQYTPRTEEESMPSTSLWRMESGSCVDRNPRPSEDDYINILPDFLFSVVTYRSSNKELSPRVRILLRVAATVQSTHRQDVYVIYSTLHIQRRSLCHLQYNTLNTLGRSLCYLQYTPRKGEKSRYNQHTGDESTLSTVQSTHRGGVCVIYSTINTQGRSLRHLKYNQHTGE